MLPEGNKVWYTDDPVFHLQIGERIIQINPRAMLKTISYC